MTPEQVKELQTGNQWAEELREVLLKDDVEVDWRSVNVRGRRMVCGERRNGRSSLRSLSPTLVCDAIRRIRRIRRNRRIFL